MDTNPNTSDQELRSLEERFERRAQTDSIPYAPVTPFQLFSRFEKEYAQGMFLKDHFGDLSDIRVLEVGAGSGANVYSFWQLGIQSQNYYGNELVPALAQLLEKRIARDKIFLGDIRNLEASTKYDVVYASTVFSSILNLELAKEVAAKMWELTKPGGLVLWYDIRVDNPRNKEVRGIGLSEIRTLFPQAQNIRSKKLTLAPPIGRRVGRLYNFVNFPFLRSHILAAISKPIE